MTRITINLPLVDARACTGCPLRVVGVCRAFLTKRDGRPKKLRTKNLGTRSAANFMFVRLPECLAAEVEEVRGG